MVLLVPFMLLLKVKFTLISLRVLLSGILNNLIYFLSKKFNLHLINIFKNMLTETNVLYKSFVTIDLSFNLSTF